MTQTVQPPNSALVDATITAATSSYVNVREQPNVNAAVLKQLRPGDSVRYHAERVTAGTYQIDHNNHTDWYALDVGWLACDVVVLSGRIADTPLYKLTVPFVSQSGATANRFNEDCGPAGCVMVARFYYVQKRFLDPVNFTVNDFAAKSALASNDIGLTSEQLAALLRGYGVNAQGKRGVTLNDLSASLAAGFPPIALVNYKDINLRHPGDLGHFIVLYAVGTTGFWYHDPYLLGANQYVKKETLSRAMNDVAPFTSFPNQAVLPVL